MITLWALLESGEDEPAQAHITTGLALAEELGAKRFAALFMESLARINYYKGNYNEATQIMQNAISIMEQYDFMRYMGPWLFGTLALVTRDDRTSALAMKKAEELLANGCLGHNYFQYYATAIDISLLAKQWHRTRDYTARLEQFNQIDPNAWADFKIRRGRVVTQLAEHVRSPELSKEIQILLDIAASAGLRTEQVTLLQQSRQC